MKASAKILFIDDDPAVLMTVGDRLTLEGYEVAKAASGDEALQCLRTMTPDLIILDISMPGMTGLAFLKKISMPDGRPRYPVLVFTARANMEPFFNEMDVEGFLAKTSDPNDLLREVDRILSKEHKITRPAGADVKAGKRRILIAEDDPRVSAQMIGFFTHAGYETFWVKDGSHLVEMAVSKQPDIVLLKMAMPRLGGAVAASILATVPKARGIPIILYDNSGLHKADARYTNVERFVPSHSPAELLKAIAAIIGASPTPG